MILDKLFSTKSRIFILRELSKSNKGLSNSELAKKTGLSAMTVSKIINQLEKEEIIKSETRGNMKLSMLNKEIIYYDDIKHLFKWEESLEKEILTKIVYKLENKYKDNISIILFGSRARKEEKISSDFDIMIITKNGKKKVKSEFLEGLLLSVFKIPKKLFIKKLKEKDPLILNVYSDGKVLKGIKEYEKIIRQN